MSPTTSERPTGTGHVSDANGHDSVGGLPGSGPGPERFDPDLARHVHVVLLGPTGAGKTTVGRIVANELGRPFVDSDSMISLRSGRRPTECPDADRLHSMEVAALRRVLGVRDSVVYAAAAGVVDEISPAELTSVWTVWLDASPDVIARRLGDEGARHVLGADPRAEIERQHREWSSTGRRLADLAVPTDDRTAREVAAEVCAAWREWARRPVSRTSAAAERRD